MFAGVRQRHEFDLNFHEVAVSRGSSIEALKPICFNLSHRLRDIFVNIGALHLGAESFIVSASEDFEHVALSRQEGAARNALVELRSDGFNLAHFEIALRKALALHEVGHT